MQVCYFEKSSMGDPKTQFWGVFWKNLPVKLGEKGITSQVMGFWVPPTCIKELETQHWARRCSPSKYLAWGSSFLGVFYRSVENSPENSILAHPQKLEFLGVKTDPLRLILSH